MSVHNEKNKSKWTKEGYHWYFSARYKNAKGETKQYKSKMYKDDTVAKIEEAKFLARRNLTATIEFRIVADEYFNDLEKKRKGSTVSTYRKDYRNNILPYFEDCFINDIDIQKIRLWALEIDFKTISVAYKNKNHTILCKIFDYAIKNFGLKDNPPRIYGCFEEKQDQVIKDEEKIRYIIYDEFKKFISVIDKLMWKTFFIVAYFTGCRRGEIQALTWEDIDFEKNEISINKTLYEEGKGKVEITSTKNNLNRKIKMSKTLIDALLIYKQEVMEYEDFKESWFVFGNTRFLPKTTIDRNKDKYFELSGVRRITMHEFRHSHVSLLINEYVLRCREREMKVDTAKFFLMLSNRMGHTIQVMTDTYMHLFPTIQDEIVDILDSL